MDEKLIKEDTTDYIRKAFKIGVYWVSLRIVLGTCLIIYFFKVCLSDVSQWKAER